MQVFTEKAYAKINLGLKVLKRRPDGYHDILSVLQTVDLSDSLRFEPAEGGAIEVVCEDRHIPTGRGNLAYQAAEAMQAACREQKAQGVRIDLRKQIPVGAGLGGGSSDAAAVLLALDRAWELNLSRDELGAIALGLGSDVGFFLQQGTAIVSGRGDKMRYVQWDGEFTYLLVDPGFHIPTGWAYDSLKIELTDEPLYVTFLNSVKNRRRLPPTALFECLENDFLPLVESSHPEVRGILDALESAGALVCSLSGSGSTLYGVFSEGGQASEAGRRLRQVGYRSFLCRAV
mgnify:CR=1 FL=1